jgi:hypothetical protein
LTLCGSYSPRGASYSYTGDFQNNAKSTKTATVRDAAGNSSTCSTPVYSKTQNSLAYCSSCGRCKNAGCEYVEPCTKSCCGQEESDKWKDFTKKACSTYGSGCYAKNTFLGYNNCYCTVKTNKTCSTEECCGCTTYKRNCQTCSSCDSNLSYGNWYDGSHAEGWSGSIHYKKRTVYY